MITATPRPPHRERQLPSRSSRWRPRVVLLDRDGVINVNRELYVRTWEDFEFLPGALDALALLHRCGLRVAVVTNQSAINRGLTTRAAMDDCHRRMLNAVAAHGGAIEGVFLCPHRPEEGCACRKPAPGLLLEAAEKHGFAMQDALLVGDQLSDLQAAERAGCASILALTGRLDGAERLDPPPGCIGVMPDLLSAARWLAGVEGVVS
ncbi:MAG: D-glycero-alpha-D-manno-heptose-1,7-bisphosphate 7-phosphatase [Solirubrobacteraceae bacterium]